MSFYLGTRVDPVSGEAGGERVLYEPKHLTTHGICFGMTGSGKTGLCLGLLEEAGRHGIPIIAIDPKGDLTNLALAWPDLAPERFAEWVDPADVEDAGGDGLALGRGLSERWQKGLDGAGIGPDERRAYREGTAITVYTPGSSAGIPVSLLDRFDPPARFASLPGEEKSELIEGLVSAVLGLVDVDADPLRSKEAILCSNILSRAWEAGQSVDLPGMIRAIADPPFDKLGVFDLEEFFPRRKRSELAMRLNGLVASPSFAHWLQGVPLDLDQLLARDERGSRTSIFYTAHLDDGERMGFITLLLDRLVAWMRDQPGTGDLRALLYFDEVFGYVPPVANPPSKRPILTLLKQARAFGLGVLLATQNPVDVDYKALTNAGTWLIGKLQTDQDKERILDGLVAASSGQGRSLDRTAISDTVSALRSRQFLLSNAHDTESPVFKTRFVMSYLRGPLTRQEVARLTQAGFYNLPPASHLAPRLEEVEPARESSPPSAPAPTPRSPSNDGPSEPPPTSRPPVRPPVGPAVQGPAPTISGTSAAPARESWLGRQALVDGGVRHALGLDHLDANGGAVTYRPALLARARVGWRTADGRELPGSEVSRVVHPLPARADDIPWVGPSCDLDPMWLSDGPMAGARFEPLPRWLASAAHVESLERRFKRALEEAQVVQVPGCPPLGEYGVPGESLGAFKARLARKLDLASERVRDRELDRRDAEVGLWDKKLDALREELEMDKRELELLQASGDEKALAMARDRARLRLERYREVQKAKHDAQAEAASAIADSEFSAMDKLAASTLVDVSVDPQRTEVLWLGVLWVPAG